MRKRPPEFYDEAYLRRPMVNGAGATRWEDNGLFFGAAVKAAGMVEPGRGRVVLHIGAGRGYLVRHLRNLGYDARGIEYGVAGREAAVVPGIEYGDLCGRLPTEDRAADVVVCHGVLSHLPPMRIPNALQELARVTRPAGKLWTNIQIGHDEQSGHHLAVYGEGWWEPRFEAAGWIRGDGDRSGETWSCVWQRRAAHPYEPSMYGEEFFSGKVDGRNRLEDSGIYLGHAQALAAMLGDGLREARVLSVADGIGHASKHLLHLGAGAVVHTDLSEYALAHSALRSCGCDACRVRGTVMRADARDLGGFQDGAYDAVWCVNLLGYLPREDAARAVAEMARKVAPGGLLALQTCHADEHPGATRDARGWPEYASDPEWEALFAGLGWRQDEEALDRCQGIGKTWEWALRRS